MAWYWWLIIGVSVVLIGYLKLRYFNQLKKKNSKHNNQDED